MELSKVSTKYGAPMGRHSEGDVSDAFFIEVEWVPFVDGCYDCQGAYWGGPDNLYCAVGYNEDMEEESREYHRAESRDDLIEHLTHRNGDQTFLPENGSLIKQTIERLEGLLGDETDDDQINSIEDDIGCLQCLLDEKGLA